MQAETAARHLRELGAGYQQVRDFAQVCSEAWCYLETGLCISWTLVCARLHCIAFLHIT